jgi:hypothetical protein
MLLKSDIVAVLPEFRDIEEEEFNTFISSASVLFPIDEYIDEKLAQIYWVASYYYESMKRQLMIDNMGKESEKIDDITNVFKKIDTEENPYRELFETQKVSIHCSVPLGFMCAD